MWRVLRKEGIYLQRLRTWCVSTDPGFAPKATEIVGLYLDPPLNALAICVDEKPSIQALQRPSGYVETDSGAVVRAMKSTRQRHAEPVCRTRNRYRPGARQNDGYQEA